MQKLILKLIPIFSLVMFLILPNFAKAEVLFEDNFDEQQDWYPNNLVVSTVAPPTNWSYYRVDEYWSPYAQNTDGYGGATPGSQPSLQIKGGQPYVSSGKAFVFYNEGVDNSPNGGASGWSSDGDLTKVLDQDYPEVYIRYKIKYQPDYKRHWWPGFAAAMKTFRFYHWDRIGSPYQYFDTGHSAPIFIMISGENEYGVGLASDTIRCDPQETNYSCTQNDIGIGTGALRSYALVAPSCTRDMSFSTDSPATTTQSIGPFDGQWHTLVLHAKLNSAPGVADGIYEVKYDGCTTQFHNGITWIGTGGDINAGWNTISLGGNSINYFYSDVHNYKTYGDGAEQWYAIDDVVVSTTAIPDNYVIPNSDTTAPSAPTGLNVM